MKKDQEYQIFSINEDNAQQVISFTLNNYTQNEPLSIYRKVTAQEFNSGFHNLLMKSCLSGFSFGIRINEQIVSVILVVNYEVYNQKIIVSQNLRPIQILIQTLQDSYQPADLSKTLSIFIACTSPLHMRKGLFYKLAQKAQQQATKKGYKQLIADCTNQKSKNALSKLGFCEISKINYKEFQFEGQYPFMGIKEATNVYLMAKKYQN